MGLLWASVSPPEKWRIVKRIKYEIAVYDMPWVFSVLLLLCSCHFHRK